MEEGNIGEADGKLLSAVEGSVDGRKEGIPLGLSLIMVVGKLDGCRLGRLNDCDVR